MSSVFGLVNLLACGCQIYNLYRDRLMSEKKTNMASIFFILSGGALSTIVSLVY